MKKKKRAKRKAKSRLVKIPKMSEMIISFAGDYILLGKSIQEKQSYLNAACAAWNISILPEAERKEAVNQLISRYESANPDIEDKDNFRHDIDLLISEKIRLFPNVRREIVSAVIIEEDGEDRIKVASLRN